MKLTKKRAEAVRKVIGEHRLIQDRARILDKRGYKVIQCPIFMRGRAPVGIIHEYKRSCRLQIGSPSGYMKYAWVVVFDPLSMYEIHNLNFQYFGNFL